MAIKKVYHCRLNSCNFVFSDGHSAPFVQHMYYTDNVKEIEELDAEVAVGHPHIYINENFTQVDTDKLDPFADIKKKAIEEYIAAQKAAASLSNDRGNYVQGPTVFANSSTIAEAAAGSDGLAAGAIAEAATVSKGIQVGSRAAK